MLPKTVIYKMNKLGKSQTPFIFIFDFECHQPLVFPIDQIPEGILFKINKKRNYKKQKVKKDLSFDYKKSDFETYQKAFNKVLDQINYGNSYLLNLCSKTELETNYSLLEIFHASKAKYKLYFNYAGKQFTVFSPEIFIQIKKSKIFTHPMKGTIDAGIKNAKQLLIDNPKEQAEHYTIVDLLRNDLSLVAKKVRVKKYRYLDSLKTNQKNLLQTSSKIVGELPQDHFHNIGNIIDRLLPAGSISGAPKKKTFEIIQQVETEKRGYYSGIMGYFDGNQLDAGIMIRFIEKIGDKFYYRSGGGITYQSNCLEEYDELNNKIYVPTD